MVSAGRSVFAAALELLTRGLDLGGERMGELMQAIFRGECTEAELGGLLIALRMKGETAEELAAAAAVLREHSVPLKVERDDVLDTCGTGGDGTCTFNISTATALVAAGAGVPVVKHGNRAISSQSGSADVLAVLGVQADPDPAQAQRCLARAGMAFCLAPHYHPSLRHVGVVRRQLGVRTLFNCLGPLANPANAPYQLLGVGQLELLDRLAGALALLGTRHAFLVCGHDGLDEVSLSAPTHVREVRGHEVTAHEWAPADFGLAPCRLEELRVSGPAESAAVIRAVLDGEEGPARRVVLANAAAALLAAERVRSIREGVDRAAEAVDSGRAARVLAELATLSPAGPT
jgi:anthranilate phosphoribosyltransferase